MIEDFEFARNLLKRSLDELNFDASHLLRRDVDEPQLHQTPHWATILLALTFLFFAILLVATGYALQHVVATLAIVESPIENVPVDNKVQESPSEPLLLAEKNQERTPCFKPSLITSKIRTTLHHLRAQGGFFAPWRGYGYMVLWTLMCTLVKGSLFYLLSFAPLNRLVANVIATVLCSPLHMALTHAIISKPSSKSFRKRIPSFKCIKHLALPAVMRMLTQQAALFVPVLMSYFFIFSDMDRGEDKIKKLCCHDALVAVKVIGVLLSAFIISIFIQLPAFVTLVRVEAAMLPEDDQAIVPFDRSFGTALEPARCISFLQAWKSFGFDDRKRLVCLVFKIYAIQLAVVVVAIHVLTIETIMIGAKNAAKSLHDLTH